MRSNRPVSPRGMPNWSLPAIAAAIVVAGAVVFAGYEIGRNSAGSPKRPAATGTPSSTAGPSPSPSPTAKPTPSPSVTVSPSATASPSVTPTASVIPGPSPTGTLSPGSLRQAQAAAIRAQGYLPRGWAYSDFPDGSRLWAWKATCGSSADHYCQKVFFFHDGAAAGTDTSTPSRDILSMVGTGISPPAIAVKYANYKPGDGNCCPSGKPVTVTYTWNGSGLTPSGPAPGH